jgi:hypothetical protein
MGDPLWAMPRQAHCASDATGATSDTSSTEITETKAGIRHLPSPTGALLLSPMGALCWNEPRSLRSIAMATTASASRRLAAANDRARSTSRVA